MGLHVKNAVKCVGLIMLEMMKAKWGRMLAPDTELVDLYDMALSEFQHFQELEGHAFDNLPGNFRQMVIDDLNRYLESKGMLL